MEYCLGRRFCETTKTHEYVSVLPWRVSWGGGGVATGGGGQCCVTYTVAPFLYYTYLVQLL